MKRTRSQKPVATTEVRESFGYFWLYRRRRGWFTKPTFGTSLAVSADADFELNTISVETADVDRQWFSSDYNFQLSANDRTIWKAPVWYFNSPVKLAIPFRSLAGTRFDLQFSGTRFKLTSRLTINVRLAGAQVYST